MGLVVGADLVGGHGDGAVGDHRIIDHEIIHVSRGIAFLDRLGDLQRVVHAAGVEQGAVLRIVLLVVDRVLDVVPVGAELAAAVGVDALDEGPQAVGGEVAGLVHEDGILRQGGGDVLPAHQGHHFVLTHGDAGVLRVLDKHVSVKKLLPGGVADLLLGLLVAACAEQFVDGRVTVDVGLEIRIGNVLACDLADVILGRHRIECRLQRAGVDDEGKEGQRDDDGNHEAEFNAYFFKYRHCYVVFTIFR